MEICFDSEEIKIRDEYYLSLSEEEFNKASERLEAWHGAVIAKSYDSNGILRGSLLLNQLELSLVTRDALRRKRSTNK